MVNVVRLKLLELELQWVAISKHAMHITWFECLQANLIFQIRYLSNRSEIIQVDKMNKSSLPSPVCKQLNNISVKDDYTRDAGEQLKIQHDICNTTDFIMFLMNTSASLAIDEFHA